MESGRVLSDAGVSAREAEVLDALAEHLTNAEIGRRLSISIRTVESHVSSLLRKLGVADRRELARLAVELAGRGPGGAVAVAASDTGARPGLPAPLTSFVGRHAERSALATAVRESRLVTALGPGGQGKTRLALAVAGDVSTEYSGGVWYVDLVPVTDPTGVAPAVADTLEITSSSGRSAADAVVQALADRSALLVLDNCEHLLAGVATFVEHVLARCPQVRILTTSRARLLVPFERVFPVPGLSLPGSAVSTPLPVDELGDAVTLFVARATAMGRAIGDAGELARVAAICRALDGSALAIELAAARLPTLGLDGLEVGLDDRLRLLTGGARADERHSSLRAALDWSYDLASPEDQALLRRVSVFAAPFDAAAAAAVVGFDPLPDDRSEVVGDALARLADESLVVVQATPQGTRYRVLETIRQYGMAKLAATGESDAVRERHLGWCRRMATELLGGIDIPVVEALPPAWAATFDVVVADLRAALGWLAEDETRRPEAYELVMDAARLAFERGYMEEAQRRYLQAASLASADDRGAALLAAAEVAGVRSVGDDVIRLAQDAAADFEAAGAPVEAARAAAFAATWINRSPGTLLEFPSEDDVQVLIDRARALVSGDPGAEAAVAVAVAFASFDSSVPAAEVAAGRAVELSQEAGDVLLEVAALDDLTVAHAASGDLAAATASTRRRVELLAQVVRGPAAVGELLDAYNMATEVHAGIGELVAAAGFAEHLLRLPLYREGHLASIRTALPHALAGDCARVVRMAATFRTEWERQGRPAFAYPSQGTSAVAMVHGLRGDFEARADWLALTEALRTPIERTFTLLLSWRPTFDAVVLLHHGELDAAFACLDLDPADMTDWYNAVWRQWYTAVWVEAAVLTDHPSADERLARADEYVGRNPVASGILARIRAWMSGDADALLAASRSLDAAACPYQAARTLVLAGGKHRIEGQDRLEALGTAPMSLP